MPGSRARLFLGLYVCAIVYLSFYPGTFLPYPRRMLQWVPLVGRRTWLDAALNILFYVPLGAAAVVAIRRRWMGWAAAICGGSMLSLLVEYLQRWSPSRYPSINDWAANTLGATLGALLAWSLHRWAQRISPNLTQRPPVVLWFSLWALWRAFPFIPRISLAGVVAQVTTLGWNWRGFAEAALGFAALRLALGPSRWLWAAFALLPAEALFISHDLSWAALAGAALGWLIAARRLPAWLLAAALLAWLGYEQLRPFAWSAPARPFLWAPFGSWWEAGETSYYPVIFGKFFLYTATVWALRKCSLRWWTAAGIPAALLAAGEALQRYQPSRTPESTDVVLVLAGAALLHWAERERGA